MESGSPEYHIIEPQLRADGRKAWLDTSKVPLRDAGGEVIGVLGMYEDITKRVARWKINVRSLWLLSPMISKIPLLVPTDYLMY
jgi:hypothetical protein